MAKQKTGRKTKLTKQTTQKFVEAIKMGCTYALASQYAGVNPSTFYLWMKNGKNESSPEESEFYKTIKRAEAEGAMTSLNLIQKAGLDDWRASAWLMERRHQYIKTNQIKVQEPEEESTKHKTTVELLKDQQKELVKASKQALNIGSFQAYAALQRQVLQVTMQLNAMDISDDELQKQSDDELMQTIVNVIQSLPPVLQQQLKNDIGTKRTKLTSTITDEY